MTYQEIKAMVEGFGPPAAYYQFQAGTGQQPPFICWYFTGDDDFAADNRNYQRIRSLRIEVYTDTKDFTLEEAVEDTLDSLHLPYSKVETHIDSERMHMTTYDLDMVITTTEKEDGNDGKE